MGYAACFIAGGFVGIVLFVVLNIASEADEDEDVVQDLIGYLILRTAARALGSNL